ncbi:MAG: dephospho-CoA kinase [Chitinophagaceae bacterium]|nr:dephospho-CoA kinase [Chitinophagaceae bacterium]
MALHIGLTGGIGSGKSTVAKIFEVLGIPVYYADEAAKNLMNTDEELKAGIKKHFGDQSYTDNQLNRNYLAEQVFNDNYKLELLNSLVHPVTIRDAGIWMLNQKGPYTIKEAALLFESGSAENLDYIIGVYAPQSLRIKRVMDRDHATREEVIKRINRQVDDEIKMKLCDFIIHNDGQHPVIPQVIALHEKFSVSEK